MVAYVAYEGGADGVFVPGGRRGFQGDLRRSVGSRVSKVLDGLVADNYLEVDKSKNKANMTMAYEYRLHKHIQGDERAAWVELARQLFDPVSGVVGTFLTRPSVKHGHVMLSGFAVLGLLQRYGPLEVRSIVKMLAPIMSRNTVITRIERLEKVGVVMLDGTTVSCLSDWSTTLDKYEVRMGLKDFANDQDTRFQDERERRYAELAGGVERVALRYRLRHGVCVSCGVPADEVEHFPARRWNGYDHPMLMTSLCSPCNNRRGQIVKATAPPPRLVLLRRYRKYPSTVSPIEWAAQAINDSHRLFMDFEETGDADALEASMRRSTRGLARLEFAELRRLASPNAYDSRTESLLKRILQALASPPDVP